MDGLVICGGYYNTKECLKFSSGQWNNLYTMVKDRNGHSSWQLPKGLLLCGGVRSINTTEIVPVEGGNGGPSFNLKYESR